ncbi:glutamate ABC transporter substrate-binding protein [Pseudoclavibacter sp. 13-3]|uniref:glutamate ABC transporter substrate-binding protein n=1 Tax=Pseudoclavibacter sp. 13-3 TaxID=2901228 RepID=UPI001E481A8B|nr:glutamate ABC transporter substrate-binding protein [Pseudoclavibacter sp. 13-3]MCD7101353.1 glutamate ABC transporter substrate-binding protein [Pseudoclavibacter sp. 13-3]
MNMRRKLSVAGALAAAVGLALTTTACSSGGSGSGSEDTITVGVKYDQPGMGLNENGEITGFDADMAREIAKRMGKEVKFVESVSSQRETLLQNGTVDMILATYTINEKRDQVIDWAGPYLNAGQDILVTSENPKNINGPGDLNGKVLCAVEGSNSTERLRDQYAQDAQLYPAQTYSECIELLSSGNVDAVSTDDVILAGFAAQDQYKGKFQLVGKPFSEEPYGVGIPQGSDKCEAINTAISDIISDGTWENFVKSNFGDSYTPDPTKNPPTPRGCDKNI